jgi:hypothetical protein
MTPLNLSLHSILAMRQPMINLYSNRSLKVQLFYISNNITQMVISLVKRK